MLAVQFDHYGDVDVLETREVDDPEPAEGQLLVRVKAAGINPGEAKIRAGELHDRFPATFPSGQGSDLAGVVEAVGPGVTDFSPGDEVIGFTNNRASQAELALVHQTDAVNRPANVSWAVAGSLYVAGTTAYAMVAAVGISAGETVVVAGATGGVGSIAVQLAALRGAIVIGIAGPRNASWLTEHGIVHVPYGDDLAYRLREAAPNGIDALLDAYGPPYVDLAIELGVAPERVDTIADFGATSRHSGVKTDGNAAGGTADVLRQLAELIAEGRLEVPIAATYSLKQVREAYTFLEQEHPLGKVVLIP